MTETELRRIVEVEPFAPVTVHTTDGVTYDITRSGRVAVSIDKCALAVDGRIYIVSNESIARVTPLNSNTAP